MGTAIICFITSIGMAAYALVERFGLDEKIDQMDGAEMGRFALAMSGVITVRDVRFLGCMAIAAIFFCAALILTTIVHAEERLAAKLRQQQAKPPSPAAPEVPPSLDQWLARGK